jgi:thiamine pyrophosphate-dependent acetolactate synthase large subunit-like protein
MMILSQEKLHNQVTARSVQQQLKVPANTTLFAAAAGIRLCRSNRQAPVSEKMRKAKKNSERTAISLVVESVC